jgi:hypothetical protein
MSNTLGAAGQLCNLGWFRSENLALLSDGEIPFAEESLFTLVGCKAYCLLIDPAFPSIAG